MKKMLMIAAFLGLVLAATYAQSNAQRVPVNPSANDVGLVGSWQGMLSAGGNNMRTGLLITKAGTGEYSATLVIIDQGGVSIPVQQAVLRGNALHLDIPAIKGSYDGTLNANGQEIAGTLTQAMPLTLTFKRVDKLDSPPFPFTLKPLGHNAYAAIATPTGGAGSNSGFVIGADGALVVDTFSTVESARLLLAEIHKVTPLPVKFVVNTHYHRDHVTGNGVFAEAGVVILAQRNVRDWIHTENLKFFGANPDPQQKAIVDGLTAPTIVYSSGMDFFLGERQLAVRSFPGHTGGDSEVFDAESNTLYCGDLFWRHSLPNLIDATTDSWIATLDAMIQAHPAAVFIPGHGDVGTVDDVKAFRGYLADLRQWVGEARAAGKTGDAIVDAVVPKIKEKYGDWDGVNGLSRPNVQQTALELNGEKKVPVPH